MQPNANKEIETLVGAIRGLHPLFEQSISDIRVRLDDFEKSYATEDLLRRPDYWQVVIAYDSSVRLRLIIENNLHVIETLALLVTTRYIFELSIWLRLVSSQQAYALLYYGKLLEKEREHSDGMVRQLQREITLLERFERRDTVSVLVVANKLKEGIADKDSESVRQLVQVSRVDVDREAARTFSIYADRGMDLGFGYAAHLVQAQALPSAQDRQGRAIAALDAFRKWCPADSLALLDRRWKWDREAQVVKLDGPYDFLYSYTSRLLHATPASVTTDVKNLEPDEIKILLRYIRGALLDALDLTRKYRAELN